MSMNTVTMMKKNAFFPCFRLAGAGEEEASAMSGSGLFCG
jgi:hypothetical protein